MIVMKFNETHGVMQKSSPLTNKREREPRGRKKLFFISDVLKSVMTKYFYEALGGNEKIFIQGCEDFWEEKCLIS